jgi:RNA polymerase sigma-70 factor (ECF subfamily)
MFGEPVFPSGQQSPQFATTRWSVVLAAGEERARGSDAAQVALGQLCQAYWYPLYAYVRRRGYSPSDAQDLTQAFFARLLEKNVVQAADPQKGKFRSFLLAALKDFLANERRHARTLKRGGGCAVLPLEFASGEERYRREPVDERTPDDLFERRWALTLLEQALARLRDNYTQAGKLPLFEQLKDRLGGESMRPYHEIAVETGMTEGSIKVAVHRLRGQYRELLRDEVAQTVSSEADVDEELRDLFEALGR